MSAARGLKSNFCSQLVVACSFLFVLLSVPTTPVAQIPDSPGLKIIRVVMDDNYPPYAFKDEQGELKGIVIDQWRLWEQKSGIAVRLTGMDWGEAQRRMQAGGFDVIDTIFRNEKREKIYDFTKPYARLDVPIFFHTDISGIRGPEDVRGFLVAAKSGDNAVDVLKQHGVTGIVEYPSYEKIIEAARDGKFKVFTVDKPPAHYYLHKLAIHNQFRETLPMYSGEFHRAVLKGNSELLTAIENGFASISPAEYQAIDKRWMGTAVSDLLQLRYLWYAAGIVGAFAAVAVAWLMMLRRAIRRKTGELAESEQRYRSIIDNMQDVYYRSDAGGELIMLSPSGVELLGYDSMDEMLGRIIRETFYYDPDERDAFVQNLKMKGHLYGYEVTLKRKDGTAVSVATSSHLMYDQAGKFVGVEGVFRDITSQRKAESALKNSEQKFFTAFNHAPLIMSISDIESGRYLEVNNRFCEVSGFSAGEVVGRTSVELGWISVDERLRLIEFLKRDGRVQDIELPLTAKDGRPILCLYSAEIITVDGCERLLSIALDITQRKNELEELNHANVCFQEEREKGQRLESLGLLAGGIAHDFNNILTGIVGNLSLARKMIDSEHRAEVRLEKCEKAAKRASELTQQLLTFARGGEPVKKSVDASRLITEAVSFGLRGSNIKGVVELDTDLWPIDADEGQINQALNNLLINASQALPDGGTVTVSGGNVVIENPTAGSERFVRLTIRDTGTGIPAGILSKVFDPYFTTKQKGTGLGLASVYSIITRHGGSVNVSSEIGQGTEFVICLPAAEGATASPQEAVDAVLSGTAMSGRVLIMDDEEMILDVASMMLFELGCDVDTCKSGSEAVERYQSVLESGGAYDAVILDLTVPGGMGGLEAARVIRALDPHATLIVSSGYSHDAILADFREHDFSGAVMKPYSMDALNEELIRVMGQGRFGNKDQ